MKKLTLAASFLFVLLTTSFSTRNKAIIPPPETYVGYFTHYYPDGLDAQIRVYINPSTGNVSSGTFFGSSTHYPATGSYTVSGSTRSVSNFDMPISSSTSIQYSGILTYP